MDSSLHATTPGSSRKRPRENETDSQRQKREKAAERQRRKRERDRNNATNVQPTPAVAAATTANMTGLMAFSPNDPNHHHHPPLQQPQPHLPHTPTTLAAAVQLLASSPPPPEFQHNPDGLTADELARRERVRAAARERQRKHRMLVKQRKLRDMGLDMSGNEIMSGAHAGAVGEDVHYRFGPGPEVAYPPVLPHDLQQGHPGPQMHDPQFQQTPGGPPAPGLGGQTFASTLLLSFSCAPLLKQHLLRTLHMSNEELATLEPVLAEAWERWDHARRAHYAEQAAKAGLAPPQLAYSTSVVAVDPNLSTDQQHAQAQAQLAATGFQLHPTPPTPATTATTSTVTTTTTTSAVTESPQPNEFRERFQRSIGGPTPFRSFNGGNGSGSGSGGNGNGGDASGSVSTPTSASTSTSGDAIDPQLGGPAVNGASSAPEPPANAPSNVATTAVSTATSISAVTKKGRKRG